MSKINLIILEKVKRLETSIIREKSNINSNNRSAILSFNKKANFKAVYKAIVSLVNYNIENIRFNFKDRSFSHKNLTHRSIIYKTAVKFLSKKHV